MGPIPYSYGIYLKELDPSSRGGVRCISFLIGTHLLAIYILIKPFSKGGQPILIVGFSTLIKGYMHAIIVGLVCHSCRYKALVY